MAADATMDRTFKDATGALQAQFSAPKTPPSLPPEARCMLQDFIHEREGKIDEQEAVAANNELRSFWERYVGENPQKLGPFAGVLRELRPALLNSSVIWEWWMAVIKPVLSSNGYKRPAIDDAKAFAISTMTGDEDENTPDVAKLSTRISNDLLKVYLARSKCPSEGQMASAAENAQVAQQVEDVLVALGRKKPKELFIAIDDLVATATSRLQALSLLNSFLRCQTPHVYRVTDTTLLEHLLQCLMNDTSTTALSMALTSLIMLLPHIAGSIAPHLPRLFLIYSRLLCWERFSPLSSEEERSTVTDDRVANEADEEGRDPGNVGVDAGWNVLRPEEGVIEASTPELMNYFTYLYGLYPLSFTSYIRKSRRYLKEAGFPGSDAFDLDSEVIRRRSEQFRKVHLLHPSFCNLTIEDELEDAKWSKMDPADVVGECHGLCTHRVKGLASPGPPPTSKLPDIPSVPPSSAVSKRSSGRDSPALESLRSATLRVEDTSSPVARPYSGQLEDDDHSRPCSKSSGTTLRTSPSTDDVSSAAEAPPEREEKEPAPQDSVAWLQREVQLLKNDLNFERWHKAQYSQHIGQITRKNVKDATIEAETLNLINANKALKRQLEQVQKAREATIKDSTLTRKQANSLEANMAERFNKLKTEQEKWRLDADELKRLRTEMPEYRDLLVAAEARELSKSHELQLARRDLEKLQETQTQLQETKRRLREYEYREFEFEHTIREKDIIEDEKKLLQLRIERFEDERERTKHAFSQRIAELESQVCEGAQRPTTQISMDSQALAESQARLLQLRKAHSRVLENYTDLVLDYQALRSQLQAMSIEPTNNDLRGLRLRSPRPPPTDFGFEFTDTYHPAEAPYTLPSASEPTVHGSAGLTFRATVCRGESTATESSGGRQAWNVSKPLGESEDGSLYSQATSHEGGGLVGTGGRGGKIGVGSEVRVYGRGGAQNIKLKQRDSTRERKKGENEESKKSLLRGLRGFG